MMRILSLLSFLIVPFSLFARRGSDDWQSRPSSPLPWIIIGAIVLVIIWVRGSVQEVKSKKEKTFKEVEKKKKFVSNRTSIGGHEDYNKEKHYIYFSYYYNNDRVHCRHLYSNKFKLDSLSIIHDTEKNLTYIDCPEHFNSWETNPIRAERTNRQYESRERTAKIISISKIWDKDGEFTKMYDYKLSYKYYGVEYGLEFESPCRERLMSKSGHSAGEWDRNDHIHIAVFHMKGFEKTIILNKDLKIDGEYLRVDRFDVQQREREIERRKNIDDSLPCIMTCLEPGMQLLCPDGARLSGNISEDPKVFHYGESFESLAEALREFAKLLQNRNYREWSCSIKTAKGLFEELKGQIFTEDLVAEYFESTSDQFYVTESIDVLEFRWMKHPFDLDKDTLVEHYKIGLKLENKNFPVMFIIEYEHQGSVYKRVAFTPKKLFDQGPKSIHHKENWTYILYERENS